MTYSIVLTHLQPRVQPNKSQQVYHDHLDNYIINESNEGYQNGAKAEAAEGCSHS